MADFQLKNLLGKAIDYTGIDEVLFKNKNGETVKYIHESLAQNITQADWAQTDATQVDYIKNKPFYEYEGRIEVVPLTRYGDFYLDASYNAHAYDVVGGYDLVIGETYIVSWDGHEHRCIAQDASHLLYGAVVLGNASSFDTSLLGNNEPFVIASIQGIGVLIFAILDTEEGKYHTVGIYKDAIVPHQIDKKFIPSPYFGSSELIEEILPATDVPFELEDMTTYLSGFDLTPEQVQKFKKHTGNIVVVWDGAKYVCDLIEYEGNQVFGNVDVALDTGNNGMPFVAGIINQDIANVDICLVQSLVDSPIEILPETSFNFEAVDGQSYYCADIAIDPLPLVVGTEYIVDSVIDVDRFVATEYKVGDETYIGLGNPGILSVGSDNGGRFFIYTKTASDGSQSSNIIYASPESLHFRVLYAPPVVHNISAAFSTPEITTIDSKYIAGVSWDRVIDKPFGTVPAGNVLCDQNVVMGSLVNNDTESIALINVFDPKYLLEGATYIVNIDDATYTCTCRYSWGDLAIDIDDGNGNHIGQIRYTSNVLAFISNPLLLQNGSTYHIKAMIAEDVVKKIDEKYLPTSVGSGVQVLVKTQAQYDELVASGNVDHSVLYLIAREGT